MSSRVDNLLPHPTVTPLSTAATSFIPTSALAVIEWVIFDGVSQAEAVRLYNEAGYGNLSSNAGISKKLSRWGPVWYEEQGVMRPWKLYTRKEHSELLAQGLDETNFLFVHPRDIGNKQEEQVSADHEPEIGIAKQGQTPRSSKRLAESSANKSQMAEQQPKRQADTSANNQDRKKPNGAKANGQANKPIPEDLKAAIVNKHQEWLEANKTNDAAICDPVEEALDKLEGQAKAIDKEGFKAWKLGEGGYGDY